MEIKTVSIVGLGALGVMFAHQMAKHLPQSDLRFVADEKRIRRYERDGVYCNGERCRFRYVTPKETGDPADLVIFAVKYKDLPDAVKAVKNQVGPDTVMLSLLNGISSEAIIGETYGMERLLLCVAQGMDAVKDGNRLTYRTWASSPSATGIWEKSPKKPGLSRRFLKRQASRMRRTLT
jgi:2-dehydropantoate 2-reductase